MEKEEKGVKKEENLFRKLEKPSRKERKCLDINKRKGVPEVDLVEEGDPEDLEGVKEKEEEEENDFVFKQIDNYKYNSFQLKK